MSTLNVIYHIARADFLERTRRYSFLIMLGLVLFLGYQVTVGNILLQMGTYRGEYNSAWVGSMLAIVAAFFLGWFGFFLVKGSVAHDRDSGVGQIMATTPLTRPIYALGKWLSNFLMFLAMLVVLALVGVALQIFAGESKQLELVTLLAPFLFIALPVLALSAAVAVLFETIGFLSAGFGNLVYFFLFVAVFALANTISRDNPALDPLGFGILHRSMGAAAKASFPDYDGSFILGSTGTPILGVFQWAGIEWTPGIILNRFTFLGIGMVLALSSSLFFDRFDPARRNPGRKETIASDPKPEPAPLQQANSQPVQLTPLTYSSNGITLLRVLASELKLLLKGRRWWWYAVAGGLIATALFSSPEAIRAYILPISWLWPILVWSSLGSREIRHNAQQLVFSAAAPLVRQLPASWLAGFGIATLTGSGAALKLLSAGDGAGLLAWVSGALFIPSFALASGVWSKGNKLFEVAYVFIWYLAMNGLQAVDFFGANSGGNIRFFLPFSLVLVLAAFIGRARQLQN